MKDSDVVSALTVSTLHGITFPKQWDLVRSGKLTLYRRVQTTQQVSCSANSMPFGSPANPFPVTFFAIEISQAEALLAEEPKDFFYLKSEVETLVSPKSYQLSISEETPDHNVIETLEPQIKREKAVFLLKGKTWFIKFNDGSKHGEKSIALPDLKRIRYLGHLLANPNQIVSALQLIQLVEGRSPETRDIDLTQILGDSFHLEHARVTHKISSNSMRQKVEEFIRETYKRSLDHEDPNFQDNADTWIDLQVKVRDVLSYDTDNDVVRWKKDKSRSRANARTLVKNHINLALKDIEKVLPHMHRHLTNTLETGHKCSYNPEPSIQWYIKF
jgi:hypothetical protein